jgi:hypothetical protein
VELQFTSRIKIEKEITLWFLQFLQRTLMRFLKKRSSPAPSPPSLSFSAWSTTSPLGTRPLGAVQREHTVPEQQGLLGIVTWRLNITWNPGREKA